MPTMHPCSACHRHLRASDTSCPFCAAPQRGTLAHAPLVLGCALVLFGFGCTAGDDGESDDAQTSSTSETSTSETSTSETSTSETSTSETSTSTSETSSESEGTDTSTTSTDSGGGSFYAGPDPDMALHGALEDLDDRELEPPMPAHGVRYRLQPN